MDLKADWRRYSLEDFRGESSASARHTYYIQCPGLPPPSSCTWRWTSLIVVDRAIEGGQSSKAGPFRPHGILGLRVVVAMAFTIRHDTLRLESGQSNSSSTEHLRTIISVGNLAKRSMSALRRLQLPRHILRQLRSGIHRIPVMSFVDIRVSLNVESWWINSWRIKVIVQGCTSVNKTIFRC